MADPRSTTSKDASRHASDNAHEAREPGASQASSGPSPRRQARPTWKADALVAEDNAANRLVITTILRRHGVQVTEVVDGAAAVEAFKARSFSIVFMDVQMPIMGGLEATRVIRALELEQDKPASIPIVGLSAHALVEDRDTCLAAGMDDYLTKPFDIDCLYAMLEAYLGPSEGTSRVVHGDVVTNK